MSNHRPQVLIIGGPDVDKRLELTHSIKDSFAITALGSQPTLYSRFLVEGFDYSTFHLSRRANPIMDLWTFGQLVRLIIRLKPDIVHAFDTKLCVWARLAARLAGVPVIIGTLPGLGSLYAIENLKSRIIRWIYEKLQTVACSFSNSTIFQNEDDNIQFVNSGVVSKEKSRVIYGSGVSTDEFAPERVADSESKSLLSEFGFQVGDVVVTMISRVIRSKGVFEFRDAANEVRERHPHVRFLLVGPKDNGIERLRSNEMAQLKRTVAWLGYRRDTRAILAMTDIFVLPSAYREGIPRVLLEAASMGLPLVTTDAPGCKEVVKNGINGFLVPVRNSEALGNAILRLVEQPELRRCFGRASRQRAIQYFDINSVASQIRFVYHELLAPHSLV